MASDLETSTSVAAVYADALYDAAKAASAEDVVGDEFNDLIAYMDRDSNFNTFMVGDTVDEDPRRDSLEKLFRGKMHDLLLNALLVLNKRRRMNAVRHVRRAFELRRAADHNEQEVIVETAVPLTSEVRAELEGTIGHAIHKVVNLVEMIRPELIGGMVVHVGDLQIDGSVSSRIRRIGKKLAERASHEVHSGRGIE